MGRERTNQWIVRLVRDAEQQDVRVRADDASKAVAIALDRRHGDGWAVRGYWLSALGVNAAQPASALSPEAMSEERAWTREAAIAAAREAAKEWGYAVGVHGSLRRDVDLIAAPWQEKACPAPMLAGFIAAAVDGWIKETNVIRPHGRRGYTIYPRLIENEPGPPWYIDLSVMPREKDRADA